MLFAFISLVALSLAFSGPALGQSFSNAAYQLGPQTAPPPPPPSSIPANRWLAEATEQESVGSIRKLRGNAWIENNRMIFRADEMEWNEDTGDIRASGNVYYHNFERKDELWCDRLEYNTEEEVGKFYNVRGQTVPRIIARPGVLTSSSPFHFEGAWAERAGDTYILHEGFITNCKMPSPWWRLRGPKFAITPGQKAVAYQSVFILRGVPLFFTPYFYHSLQRQPRKSGFLMPNVGKSSKGGFLLGLGYYWAINRSYDATYRLLDYTSRAYAHHVDLRGAPRRGTDYYAIIYGVQDRGPAGATPAQKFSGVSIYTTANSDLGNGWTARASINYITSFRFRQEWSQSYNELIGSEIPAVAFIDKNWSAYTFDAAFSRLENFQSAEIPSTDPETGAPIMIQNAVIIRKAPELMFSRRDQRFSKKLPVWLSWESSAGFLHRSQPVFNQAGTQLIDTFQTGDFTNRENFAPRVTGAFRMGDIHLIPSFALYETYYGESQTPFDDRFRVTGTNIVRSAREFSLDLIFPSLARVYTKKTLLGDKLKHVIEPRATYRYVTGVGTKFNDFIRFDSTDLLSNTNEAVLSLTNRLYSKRGDSIQEVFTWSLKQARYFDPTFGGAVLPGRRNIFTSTADLTAYAFVSSPRSTSPVISSIEANPFAGLTFLWQAEYDPRFHRIADSALALGYRWQRGLFVLGSNNQVHVDPALVTPPANRANQYELRVGFGDVTRRGWNGYVDVGYDKLTGTVLQSTSQLTYNTDCCGISVQYYRWNVGLRDETQWRVAFTVANVGSFGTLRKQEGVF